MCVLIPAGPSGSLCVFYLCRRTLWSSDVFPGLNGSPEVIPLVALIL